MRIGSADRGPMTIGQKLWQVNWFLVLFIIILTGIGCAMLYSAGEGSWNPWAKRQIIRFGIGLFLMIMVAVTDIRSWMRHAYTLYFLVLGLTDRCRGHGRYWHGGAALD